MSPIRSAQPMPSVEALLQRCARWNMAVYRSAERRRRQGHRRAPSVRQLGLHRLDANWLADEDGISSITVSRAATAAAASSPTPTGRSSGTPTATTTRPHAASAPWCCTACGRRERAASNALLDHELAYIALRDASPRWMRALMAPDAMTIPGRDGEAGAAR